MVNITKKLQNKVGGLIDNVGVDIKNEHQEKRPEKEYNITSGIFGESSVIDYVGRR